MDFYGQDCSGADFRNSIAKRRDFCRQAYQGWDALDFLDLPVKGEDLMPINLSAICICLHAWACIKGEERENFLSCKNHGKIVQLPSYSKLALIQDSMEEEAASCRYEGPWKENPLLIRYRRLSSRLPEAAATPANLLSAVVQALENGGTPRKCKLIHGVCDIQTNSDRRCCCLKDETPAALGPRTIWLPYGDDSSKR